MPSHLYHSLEHAGKQKSSALRTRVDEVFDRLRLKIDAGVNALIRIRYAFVGGVIALLIVSVSLMASGVVKFSAFPTIEGDILQAKILMPTGTPIEKTEQVVAQLKQQLEDVAGPLSGTQGEPVVNAVTVNYGTNSDAFESGPHLATISVDLLTAEQRHFSINTLKQQWLALAEDIQGP
ncbi:hypothetical protein [Aliamphritea spongicola]|nr:hypothetical protein [Aliamphritea spongicola]